MTSRGNFSQDNRRLKVFTDTGLPLFLRELSGFEAISKPFEYELEMIAPVEESSIAADQIVGRNVSFSVERDDLGPRYFNGFVNQFRYVGQNKLGVTYRATVVPWLWFLSQTTDCRIFQFQKTPEIIATIFSDLGFTDFDFSMLRADYHEREYCVQYRETDLDFVSRLFEEEGIFYYFRHEGDTHTLVAGDATVAYYPCEEPQVEFADPDGTGDQINQITDWEHAYEFRTGKVAFRDYNFITPGRKLETKEETITKLVNSKNYEDYDYPGRYAEQPTGQNFSRIRMEEKEVDHDKAKGTCTYRSFSPGAKISIKEHPREVEIGKSYVLTRTEIFASAGDSYRVDHDTPEDNFSTRFECIPAEVVFRPQRLTPQPIVEGPQTAVVTGPPGEEIHTDEHGQIKVQFHWDREGQYDDNTSCWMRVSQVHAGQGWGAMDIPRVGEEVIVDFLEGDPDRPLVTGRVYNAEAMPPFALPAEKTRRGNATKTYKGNGYNEMSMDDTPGKEQLRMNAQHNMDSNVNNNQTLVVGVDRTTDIGNNDTTTIGNDAAESVGNNKTTNVGNNMKIDVGNKLNINAGSSITLKCGASKIYMNSGGVITITGTIITTAAAANASVVAPLTQVVGGVMLTTVGGINMMSGGVCHVGAAGLASVAGGKVDVAASGTTAIKGGLITLN